MNNTRKLSCEYNRLRLLAEILLYTSVKYLIKRELPRQQYLIKRNLLNQQWLINKKLLSQLYLFSRKLTNLQ